MDGEFMYAQVLKGKVTKNWIIEPTSTCELKNTPSWIETL
jgi:hypothetical protein